ncbi:YybS family protein [Thermaerobacillus caldiproteolyticus]|uniref:YybS family protein n=1 Tax=Thermaerobacillus caldiproteolyticus TaxID=247480 RepID=UPI00188D82C8|nr:YybS family protein [Anoxybacillus caldiproteolyticus]QPA30936.1 YybS family protein [Anoxybacillus caldiproteolyticus]
MRNTYALTEAAIQLALFTVLFLVSLYVPLLGAVTTLFLSIPFIIFTIKHGYQQALLLLVASLVVSSVVGSLLSLPGVLMFGTAGIVIGALLAKQKNRYVVLVAGTMTFLFNMVIDYIISIQFFEMDIIKQALSLLNESFHTAIQMMRGMGQQPPKELQERFEQGLELIKYVTPTLFVLGAFLLAYVTMIVSVPILKRLKLSVGTWPPFRNFSLPKSLLWYYLLILIVTFLPLEKGTFVYIVVLNLYYLLQLLFVVQGLSFLYYVGDRKNIPKGMIVWGTVLCLFLPFLLYLIAILGIIDLGFELRKRIL